MKVNEFVTKYNEFQNEINRNNFLNGRVVKKYVPFTQKIAECTNIANATTHRIVGENTKYQKTVFKEDTNARYLHYGLKIIDLYTDIDIEWNNKDYTVVQQFEELDEYGLIELLISLIAQKTSKLFILDNNTEVGVNEVERIQNILQACVEDIISNENNLINYFDTKFETIGLVTETLMDVFSKQLVQYLQSNVSEEDMEKLKEAMKQPNNVVPFDVK